MTTLAVRKHRAPKGALRQRDFLGVHVGPSVRKHRAPKGALRQVPIGTHRSDRVPESESTERQKVH